MTDIAISWHRPTAKSSFFTRRVYAFLRLMRIRRRRRSFANLFDFADDRALADVGVRRDPHQYDWLMVRVPERWSSDAPSGRIPQRSRRGQT
jgi:hypothetical protein